MKSRLTLIFAALIVLLGTMAWVVQDRNATAPTPAMAAVPASVPSPVIAPAPAAPPAPAIMAAAVTVPLATVERQAEQPVTEAAAPTTSPATLVRQGKSSPVVHVAASGVVTYVAREGDTVSELAIALMGSDSQERRDAVIAANPSLKPNPDLDLTG